jgi:hypothetical protein
MSGQPRDDKNAPIPVMSLRPATGQQISIGSSSQRSTEFAPSTRVITCFATKNIFVELGDSTVEANLTTSHFLGANIPYDLSLGDDTISSETFKFLAAIRAGSEDGTLFISERE